MTFQRKTAQATIDLIRTLKPNVRIVVGGYDPTLATESYTGAGPGQVDFIVRGEGEITFRDLVRAIESGSSYHRIPGLSYRVGADFYHNQERPISGLDKSEIRPPKRSARVLSGYTMLGRQIDVIETSRGCTFDCSFCSIVEMRGRNFETFSFDRVIADIKDAREYGARAIFIVDDNITLNVKRFAGALRSHYRGRFELDRLLGSSDDFGDCQPWRTVGAADAQSRLSIRVPRD